MSRIGGANENCSDRCLLAVCGQAARCRNLQDRQAPAPAHQLPHPRAFLEDTHPEAHGLADSHGWRSEEHTSELQSLMRLSYAVFCLKKNTTNTSILKNNTYI